VVQAVARGGLVPTVPVISGVQVTVRVGVLGGQVLATTIEEVGAAAWRGGGQGYWGDAGTGEGHGKHQRRGRGHVLPLSCDQGPKDKYH
jgi:hypothetical protein